MSRTKCDHPGCTGNPHGRRYCSTHFTHLRLYGETREVKRMSTTGICTLVDCNRPHKAKGYCKQHYELAKYHGEIEGRRCDEESCLNLRKKRGLCLAHYMRKLRAGEFGGNPCGVPMCPLVSVIRGLCYKHDKRVRKYGLTVVEMASLDAGLPCEICGRTSEAVDHNHETGEVRGFLCTACNTAIGLLRDNPQIIKAAAAYLERTGHVTHV